MNLDEYEVAIFLRESRTRHSLLTKHKVFQNDPAKTKTHANSNTAGSTTGTGDVLVESDSESELQLRDIPQASAKDGGDNGDGDVEVDGTARSRNRTQEAVVIEDDSDGDDDDGDDSSNGNQRASKKRRTNELRDESEMNLSSEAGEDKKLRFHTDYENFNMCGWVLCLLITRRDVKGKSRASNVSEDSSNRQALMEEWISAPADGNRDED